MVTILFHSTIFGPIHSRRLGTSLGVNLSPVDGKICTFDCIYCEAGYNSQGAGTSGLPKRESVRAQLEDKLKQMRESGETLDVITFSGNGEPTIHRDFQGIIDDTIALRNLYFPEVKISVLCNSTRLEDERVVSALQKVDNNILKLDSAVTETMRLIDQPASRTLTSEHIIEQIAKFGNKCIVQTMMLRGRHDGQIVDNTTDEEIEALKAAYLRIKPKEVMLYSIDRKTPEESLEKVSVDELNEIASRFRAVGIKVQVN